MSRDVDPHHLYERAVQTPEVEIDFLERVWRRRHRHLPQSLREDFCGTALLCRHWVESDGDRVARGVDADGAVLRRAHEMNRAVLDEDEAERFELVQADARERSDRTFDVIVAGNYSWAIFDDDALAHYLTAARDCLELGGLLALEVFGGSDLRRSLVHEHGHDGFTYLWEHERFDGDANELHASIHFRLEDGRELRHAFGYRFIVRDWADLAALMREAGFADVSLWVEGEAGGFSVRDDSPEDAIWGGYVVGFAGQSARRAHLDSGGGS